jgi:hypothetical protein
MITVRQIQRLWDGRRFDELTAELLNLRVEDSPRLRTLLSGSLPAAALGLIRLDELNQAHNPLAQQFVRRILGSQAADGGWDDPLISALCVRALLTSRGHGLAIDRAVQALADLQKSDGAWPKEPIRRLAEDAYTTVFVLFAIGSHEPFRQAARVADALRWVSQNEPNFDPTTAKLWSHASLRTNRAARGGVRSQQILVWS